MAEVRLASIGDSFTEGVGDESAGVPRGWADLVALGLAQHHGEIDYANLAIRGRLLAPIMTDQVDQALALDPLPTHVTVNGGGNDMLRPRIDQRALLDLAARALDRFLEAGVTPIAIAGADASGRLPMSRRIHGLGVLLTEGLAGLADERDIPFIDIFGDTTIRDPRFWSQDRLHLNSEGHRRAADIVLRGLGIDQPERALPPEVVQRARVRADAEFVGRYMVPWMTRRLRRRSSGDARVAKHRDWVHLTAV